MELDVGAVECFWVVNTFLELVEEKGVTLLLNGLSTRVEEERVERWVKLAFGTKKLTLGFNLVLAFGVYLGAILEEDLL